MTGQPVQPPVPANAPVPSLTFGETHFQRLGQAIASLGLNEFASHLAELMEVTGAYESTVVAAFPASGRPIRLFSNLSPEDEEATLRAYFDRTYLLDPWYNMVQARVADGVYRFCECVPDDFEETDYFRDYYAQTRLIDECGLFIRISENVCIVIMLGNRASGKSGLLGYSEPLRQLLPTVVQLVKKHWAGLSCITVAAEDNLASLCASKGLRGREIEVVTLLLRGFSNKLIARDLGISPETVKVYRKRINKKLGTASTREVFAMFFKDVTHEN
jgi:DNA-binding CsgD family transcriptional regulator